MLKGNNATLTPREKEIVKHICDGHTDGAIAQMLAISTATVRSHRKAILKKLTLKKTVLLVRYAIENKIILMTITILPQLVMLNTAFAVLQEMHSLWTFTPLI